MNKKGIQKILILLGGFIILVGILLFGLSTLIAFGYLDSSLLLERKQLIIFGSLMLAIGIFDTIVGAILARW